MQLDLFEKDTVKLLIEEMNRIRQQSENVQRGAFARIAELRREVEKLKEIKDEQSTSSRLS